MGPVDLRKRTSPDGLRLSARCQNPDSAYSEEDRGCPVSPTVAKSADRCRHNTRPSL
jgi:hypothetical protein